jgi:formate hydrogenlyase subunit 3/multisubunit Na+/H+ antiporter MnhD subunit
MDASQAALVLAVGAPFAGTAGILALRRRPDPREGVSLVAAVLSFVASASLLPLLFAGGTASIVLADLLPGLSLRLAADGLGLLFATIASFLWILTTVYSIGYMRGLREHAQTRYYACFALVIGATMGVALSANLFSLFVFYEILTVATYPLVVHEETEEAFRAGRKYLVYTLSGGVAILLGLAILAGMGASVDFTSGGNPTIATIPADFARIAFLLLLGGFGVKAAMVPIHGWLPSAMVAPTPVSGLLHAVAVVKAGVFGLLRTILYLLGPTAVLALDVQGILIAAAVVTILVGSFLALVQDDLKLRLAYSTVSQLSYIVLGAALLTPAGAIGATFHLTAHAFAKLAMFFVAGAIFVETGKRRVSELDGIGRRMPRTMIAFTLATIGMAGLPPMGGFVSKWYLGVGAWDAGEVWVLAILVTSSVLNLAYFLPIVVRAFLAPADGPAQDARHPLRWPIVVTAVGALVLGVWTALPYGPFEIARLIAREVIG